MPTDPSPTPEANEAPETPGAARTDLVEDESRSSRVEGEEVSERPLEAMPDPSQPGLRDSPTPPPAPPEGDAKEEAGSAEETTPATNLAYEDMLARLAVAAKDPGPEPETPALDTPSSLPESDPDATPLCPPPEMPPSGPSLTATPAAMRIIPFNSNPLLVEDEDPTIPGRRAASQAQPTIVPAAHLAPSLPFASVQAGTRSRALLLMLGGMLVLGGMLLAVAVLKLLMPTPPPHAGAIAPAPISPSPSYSPSIQVRPLPTGAHPAALPVPPAESAPSAARESSPANPEGSGIAPGESPRSPRRAGARPKQARLDALMGAAAPEPASGPEPATAPKAPPAAAPPEKEATPPPGRKSGKSAAYVDPFE